MHRKSQAFSQIFGRFFAAVIVSVLVITISVSDSNDSNSARAVNNGSLQNRDTVVLAQNDVAGELQFLDPVNGDETTIDFSATSCEDPSDFLFSPFFDAETSSLYFSFWFQYGASDSLKVYKLQDGECSVAFDVAPQSTDSSTGWDEFFDKSDFDPDSRKAAFIIYSSRDFEWSNRFVVFDLDSGEEVVYEFAQPADNFSHPAMDIHIRGDEVAFLGRQRSQSTGQFSVVTVDLGTAVDTNLDGVFELSIETLSSFESGGHVGYPEITVSPNGTYVVGFGTSNSTHWGQGGIWLFNKNSSSYNFGTPDGVNLVQIWNQPRQWGGSFDIEFGISGDLYLATSDGLYRTFGDPLEADFRLLNSDSFDSEYGIAVANATVNLAPHADDRVIFFDRDSDWVIGDLNDEDADPAYPNWPGGDPLECTDQDATTFGYFIDTATESFYWLANPVNSSSPVTIEKLTTDGECSTAFTLQNPAGYSYEAYPTTIDFDQQSRRAAAAITSNQSGNHGVSGLDSYWNDKVGLLDIAAGTQRILELSVPANDGTFVPAGEVGPYWTNYIGFREYVTYPDVEWLEISDVSIFGNQLWVVGSVGNNNTNDDYMDAAAKYDLSSMTINGSFQVPTLQRFVPINLSDTAWFSIAADDVNVYLANYDWGYVNPGDVSSRVYRISEEDVEGTALTLEAVWGPTEDTEALGIDLGSSGNLYVFDSSGMWRSKWNPHGVWDFEKLTYSPQTNPADNLAISVVYNYVWPSSVPQSNPQVETQKTNFEVSGFRFESAKPTKSVKKSVNKVADQARYLLQVEGSQFSGSITCKGFTGYNWSQRSNKFLIQLARNRSRVVCNLLKVHFPNALIQIGTAKQLNSKLAQSRKVKLVFKLERKLS